MPAPELEKACLGKGVVCNFTQDTSGYQAAAALPFVYLSAAAYCAQSQLQTWSCQACTAIPGTKLVAYLYDAATDAAGFVAVSPCSVLSWSYLFSRHVPSPWGAGLLRSGLTNISI